MAPKPDLERGIMSFGVGHDLSRINLDGSGFKTYIAAMSPAFLRVAAWVCGLGAVTRLVSLLFVFSWRELFVGLGWAGASYLCFDKLRGQRIAEEAVRRRSRQEREELAAVRPGGDWEESWNRRVKVLSKVLGPPTDRILHAPGPLHLGGQADVLAFEQFVKGIAYVTCDLLGVEQPPNALGNYELMICSHEKNEQLARLISGLAKFTLETPLQPGHTMDVGPAMPAGSTIAALLFCRADIWPPGFTAYGRKCGILLAIGITAEELAVCHAGHAKAVLGRLRRTGVFPFTELRRSSV